MDGRQHAGLRTAKDGVVMCRSRARLRGMTGATVIESLIQYSAEAGAILGRVPLAQRHQFAAYGRDLGAAFQIADDLLDSEGTTEETGKTAGKATGKGS